MNMATQTGQIAFRKKGETTCFEHKGKQLHLYCKQCDKLVCLKCLSTSHNRHDMCELSDITPEKKQEIQHFIDKIEQNDLQQLRNYIRSTDTLLKDNSSSFETISHNLKMQTEKLKNDLDKLTARTLSLYQKMEADNIELIHTYRQDLEMYDRQLKQQVKECKAALQRGSHIEIYDVRCEIHSKISLPVKPILGTASFTPNTNPQHHIELALGKIDGLAQGQGSNDQDRSVRASGGQESSSTSQQSEPNGKKAVTGGQESSSTSQQSEPKGKKAVTKYKLLSQTKVLEEWESPVGITSICPTIDGQVWTCDWNSDTLTLQDRKGEKIQEVKHNIVIDDISLSRTTNTVWVCDSKNNIMELVSRKLNHRFSTKKKPKCVCVTASNHVIVGMDKHITKFTTQGKMVQTTSRTGTGKPLVCTPWRISECPVTHNVAVIDWDSNSDGGDGKQHVIVMDSDFKELFVYKGDIPSTHKQSSHKGAGPFIPLGAVYDSVGNIIIGDWNNNRVLLISGGGEFLRIIHTGTEYTWAVGVDREDVLWAVLGWGNVKLLQYSIV